MQPVKPIQDFSWSFLEQISWWALGIAAAISAAVSVVTNDVGFALSCMLAASIDVTFVRAVASSGRREIEEDEGSGGAASMLFVIRLLSKAGLLVLAVLLPQILDFAGMVAGVLCFDLTLAVVGSFIAATRLMSGSRMGR